MQGWLEGLDGNDRPHPPLNPLGADTGRFSCKKPNLLATPRNSEIRGCFIPDDGFVLIEADYSNIEMRIAGVVRPGRAYVGNLPGWRRCPR